MKNSIFLLLLFLSFNCQAQKKMSTKNGLVNFEASVPLFEEVKATNAATQCVLNTKTGEIYSTALIKDFHFKIALMEKHFNEYYLESDRYPKVTFKGRVMGFNLFIIGNSPKEFIMNGVLELHGKKKEISTVIIISKSDNNLKINSEFSVLIKDFDIEIPTVLSMKIAEKVNVSASFLLK